jgi:predicted Zn-dependent protease
MREHPQLEAMLRRCLAFRQFERYVNARLLLADIDRYISTGVAGPMPTAEPAEPPTPNLNRKSRDALVQDAQIVLDNGQADKAAALAEAVLCQHPKFMPALLVLARAQTRGKRIDEARATCAKAQQLDRNDPGPLEVLADLFEADGKPSIASALRVQAVQLRGKRKP